MSRYDNGVRGAEAIIVPTGGEELKVAGPKCTEHFDAEELPAAVDSTFAEQGAHSARIGAGVYYHKDPLYLPPGCSFEFEKTQLRPEACDAVVTGDGTSEHVYQSIEGTADIRPADSSKTTAARGLHVKGSKLLQVAGNICLSDGFKTASLHLDGSEIGSWWNYYRGLEVKGRFLKESAEGDDPANAQQFNGCLFRGQSDILNGNSLRVTDSFFENISEGETINIQSGCTLSGRFEAADIVVGDIGNSGGVTIDAERWVDTTLDVKPDIADDRFNFDVGGAGYIEGTDEPPRTRTGGANQPAARFETGYYQGEKADGNGRGVVQGVAPYNRSGVSNIYQAMAGRGDGYYLRGERIDGEVEAEVQVGGFLRLRPQDLQGESPDEKVLGIHDGSGDYPADLYQYQPGAECWKRVGDEKTDTIG